MTYLPPHPSLLFPSSVCLIQSAANGSGRRPYGFRGSDVRKHDLRNAHLPNARLRNVHLRQSDHRHRRRHVARPPAKPEQRENTKEGKSQRRGGATLGRRVQCSWPSPPGEEQSPFYAPGTPGAPSFFSRYMRNEGEDFDSRLSQGVKRNDENLDCEQKLLDIGIA